MSAIVKLASFLATILFVLMAYSQAEAGSKQVRAMDFGTEDYEVEEVKGQKAKVKAFIAPKDEKVVTAEELFGQPEREPASEKEEVLPSFEESFQAFKDHYNDEVEDPDFP